VGELSAAPTGKRNETLNAVAFRLGRMIACGWVDEKIVADALLGACDTNKYLREHGHRATMKTIGSGIEAGKKEPHPGLPDRDLSSGDDGAPDSELSSLSDLSATRGVKPRTADSDLSDLSGLSTARGAQQRRSGEQQAGDRRAATGTWDEPDS